MKAFITIFVMSYIGMTLLFGVLFLASDDLNAELHPTALSTFLVHVMDFFVMVLGALSWGASTCRGTFLVGFPVSAALLAFAITMIHRHLTRKRLIDHDA